MANEKYIQEVETRFTTSGTAESEQALRRIQDLVDSETRAGNLSEKQSNSLSKANARLSTQLQSTSSSVAALTGETKKQSTAQDGLSLATERGALSATSLRYANYDLAASYGAVSASLIGVGALTASTFADMESGFTKVERTSGLYGDALEPVTKQLLELSRVLPVTTDEIQDLAARGAQMGIATSEIGNFAEVMAKFVATSPEVDVNSVAEAFGRLSNLTGTDDFEALASSIAQVGVNSAATDAQIIKTTQEMARATNATSLTADEVVGLAAAFASLGIAPEASRGIMNQFFTQLDKGAAGMNESLTVAGQIMGKTTEEATALFQSDAGTFFQQFVTGLSGVENITVALDAMGLSGQRLIPAFKALAQDSSRNAQGQSVLSKALMDANQGFVERTELSKQFAPIADDLNSKLTLMGNSFRELAYAVGLELAPALKGAVDAITDTVTSITDFVNTPIGGFVTKAVAALGGLVAAYTGLRGVIALATASTAALSWATQQLGGTGILAGLRGLKTEIQGIGTAAGTSAVAMEGMAVSSVAAGTAVGNTATKASGLTSNLGKLAKGGGILAGISLLASAFTDLGGTVDGVIDTLDWWTTNVASWTSGVKPAIGLVLGFAEAFGIVDTSLLRSAYTADAMGDIFSKLTVMIAEPFIRLSLGAKYGAAYVEAFANYVVKKLQNLGIDVSNILSGIGNALGFFGQGISDFASSFSKGFTNGVAIVDESSSYLFGRLRDLASSLPRAGEAASAAGGSFGGAVPDIEDYGNALDGVGDSADSVAEKLYTVVDYADDLASVWKRAFEIRFSGEQTFDAVRDSIQKVRDAAEASAKRILDLRNSIRSLTADISGIKSDIGILEYYLKIAREYGDTKRATALEAELAKKRAELAEKTAELAAKNKDLKKEQETQNKTLVGNSQAARDNRKTIQDLVQQYQEHIRALAASGMSQDDLARATQRLKQDFINQATQLGYNRTEVLKYARAFDDVAVAIARVPRTVTVSIAGLGPAQAALKEFEAKVRNSMTNARNTVGSGVHIPISSSFDAGAGHRAANLNSLLAQQANYLTTLNRAIARGDDNTASRMTKAIRELEQAIYSIRGYSSGGYTGRGGKYQYAGSVHRGEYVIPKEQVNQATGLPYASALGNLMGGLPSRTVAPASSAQSSGAAQVSLTAGTIQAIAQAVQPYLVVDGKLVGEAASNSYAHQNTVGAY